MSTSQLNKLKSGIKNGTEVTFKISLNVVRDSNDENSFPHKLLLTNKQVSKLRKTFANNSSANIKLSKTQLHKIGQLGGPFLGPLLKSGLPLIGNVIKPLAKSVLIPLGLPAAESAADAVIHEKMFGSNVTILIISNEEMNDIIKLVKSYEESGLLIKRISEQLLGTLGANLLGNIVARKGVMRAGKCTVRAGQNF